MMTNIIAYLHTTFAYQSAAMQLMVGQANFDAQQLHLRETLPMTAPATNLWNVAMPPYGISGSLATSNYIYRFSSGKLTTIQIRNQPHGPAEMKPSLIDTNGAYELASNWLAALSVDVPALEAKYPHTVQSASPTSNRSNVDRNPSAAAQQGHSLANKLGNSRSTRDERKPATDHPQSPPAPPAPTNRVARVSKASNNRLPVFRVTWGAVRDRQAGKRSEPQVTLEIIGSTKQCLGLRILNPDLLTAPPLQVTNAAALLGTPPAPQHYVEEFLGGKTAYNTVAQPDKLLVWLVGSSPDDPSIVTNRTSAMVLTGSSAAAFSRALTDFNSYSWIQDKACAPEYGVRLQFTKGADIVDVSWCDICDHLQVTHNGISKEKDCDAARATTVGALKSIFPKDEIIKSLGLTGSNQPQ